MKNELSMLHIQISFPKVLELRLHFFQLIAAQMQRRETDKFLSINAVRSAALHCTCMAQHAMQNTVLCPSELRMMLYNKCSMQLATDVSIV